MYAATCTGTSGKVPIVCHCAACRAGTMLVYIYKAKKPSVYPSVCLSVMPITHLGLPTLPYQLPNIKSSWWTDFFSKTNTFCMHVFLKFSFDYQCYVLGIPSTHWNETWMKLNALHLTRTCWLLIDSCFVCPLQQIEGTGVEGRQGTAVIRCGTFLWKTFFSLWTF